MKLLKMVFGVVIGTVLFLLIFLFSPASGTAEDILDGYQSTKQFSTDKESIDSYIMQMKESIVNNMGATLDSNGAISESVAKDIVAMAEYFNDMDTTYNCVQFPQPWNTPKEDVYEFCCASFVSYVLYNNGVIPSKYCDSAVRTLYGYNNKETRISDPISEEELMPGDIIYFDGGTRLSHVALYIGDGWYIDSANYPPVNMTKVKLAEAKTWSAYKHIEYGRVRDFSAEIAAEKGAKS